MPGKSRLTSYLPAKSARTTTTTGVITIRSSIPHRAGRRFRLRNSATLWLKCSNPINKDDKKPLAMSYYPQLRASFIIWIRSGYGSERLLHSHHFIILQLQNHWITRIMALIQPLSICYQKTFKNAANPYKRWIY